MKEDYWKLKQASREDSPKETKEEIKIETGLTTSSGMVDEFLTISIVSPNDQHWLLESGASTHMCLHINWFPTYESIDDGIVYMGNDFSCKVVGIDSI
jgi:hypothetical protein